MKMPLIDLAAVPEQHREIVARIVATRGPNKGRLLASKPTVTRHPAGKNDFGLALYEPDRAEGEAAYVWRMVAFYTSPDPRHQCAPCTADFDVPGDWGDEKRARLAELDLVVNAVLATLPVEEWHGVRRWGNVYGVVGTPQVTPEGAIIYR